MNGWLIYDHEGAVRNRWFIDQLLYYAGVKGEILRYIPAEEIRFGVKNGQVFVEHGDDRLPDYAIVRTINPLLSSALEKVGVHVYNNAHVSEIANDKRRTQALCAELHIPTPDTLFLDKRCFDPQAYIYPAILKSPDGHGGSEVFYVENVKSALNAVEKLKTNSFLLQEVVDKGRDVRMYMLGGKLLCAVERTSETDFRSNFSLGGTCKLFMPTSEMLHYAQTIAGDLDAAFIGVDFLFRNGKPLLGEIEDVVGARMVYKLTRIQTHASILDYIFNKERSM